MNIKLSKHKPGIYRAVHQSVCFGNEKLHESGRGNDSPDIHQPNNHKFYGITIPLYLIRFSKGTS